MLQCLSGSNTEVPLQPTRQSRRYPVRERSCFLVMISFKDHHWKEHHARILDLSRQGVGIEVPEKLEEGFVWFRSRVGGARGGVLMWCRPAGGAFRAGIRFVPLSIIEETTLREQLEQARIHKPLRIPERVIATIMMSMTKVASEQYLDASGFLGDLDKETEKKPKK